MEANKIEEEEEEEEEQQQQIQPLPSLEMGPI